MASIFAIKNRIHGVESTGKITKSMKLVSTSKLHQSQAMLKNIRDYSDGCARALSRAAFGCGDDFPLLRPREDTGRTCYVLFIGDRGLCGSYNQDVLLFHRAKLRDSGPDAFTVICGKRGLELRDDPELRVKRVFADMGDTPSAAQSRELSDYLRELYLSDACDRVYLVYQRHRGLGQAPEMLQLLPVQSETEQAARECIFEPDRRSCIERLSDMYMECVVYRTVLEARMSEHFARMTAMTAATDNAEELLRDLTLTLNRTRQAKITTEITEVVGGAKALRRDG